MRVALFGTGYAGLVCGAGFAERGATVTCTDVDADRIARLIRGEVPVFEPGLDDLVRRNVAAGRLSFTTDPVIEPVVLVTVGTPAGDGGAPDLSAVEAVVRKVVAGHRGQTVLVLRSTVPVGTSAKVAGWIGDAPIRVVSNPEFLRQGTAVDDFLRPDRVVVGCSDEASRQTMERLFAPFGVPAERFVWTNPASAELAKYVANAMLAMRVAFVNEVAALCERVGADAHAVRRVVGSDPRIGPHHLFPGPGYGGSCLPKDVLALARAAHEAGVPADLIEATDRANRRHRQVLADKLRRHLGDLRGRRIAVWGLSFKPKTDDIRESPAVDLVDALLSDGAVPVVHDPVAMPVARARYGDRLHYAQDAYAAAEGADALVLVTDWADYHRPDFARLASALRTPYLLDGRNLWAALPLDGFVYEGIGVPGRG